MASGASVATDAAIPVLVPAPVRDLLAWVIDEAIADSLHALLAEVEQAATDAEAFAALTAFAPHVLTVIYQATGDGGARDDC